jgi:hypothetical protein
VGIRLITEILDYAPAELTASELVLLIVLAESARDDTRTCWPGMQMLTRRTRLSARHVRRVLTELAARGYEVRVSSGVDCHGMPVFASKGHRTVYRVPAFRQRGTDTAALKGDAHGRLSDPKGDISGTQRRPYPVAKGDVRVPPSPHEPSREPSNHRARAHEEIAAVIRGLRDRTGRTVDEHHAVLVIKQLVGDRPDVRDRVNYLTSAIRTDTNPSRFLPTPTPPPYRPEVARR